MKNNFKSRIIGQDHVFDPLATYVRIGEMGLHPDHEPKGCFLFTGPTGTGKTETAKVLAEFLGLPLIRFDMSEYKDENRWLEDFCARMDDTPTGIILLDEIEKGNLRIFDYFLQLLSEAHLTFRQRSYYVNSHYIIMTSNLGSRSIMGQKDFAIARRIVEQQVKSCFRPEFLGRIRRDCQLCFKPLSYDDMRCIAVIKLEAELNRLAGKGYRLSADPSVVPFLMNEGVSPEFGARPLVQTIQKYLALALVSSPERKRGVLTPEGGKIVLK